MIKENSREMDYFIGAPSKSLVHYIWHNLTDHNNICYVIDGDKPLKIKRDEQSRNRFVIGMDAGMDAGKLVDKVRLKFFKSFIYMNFIL